MAEPLVCSVLLANTANGQLFSATRRSDLAMHNPALTLRSERQASTDPGPAEHAQGNRSKISGAAAFTHRLRLDEEVCHAAPWEKPRLAEYARSQLLNRSLGSQASRRCSAPLSGGDDARKADADHVGGSRGNPKQWGDAGSNPARPTTESVPLVGGSTHGESATSWLSRQRAAVAKQVPASGRSRHPLPEGWRPSCPAICHPQPKSEGM